MAADRHQSGMIAADVAFAELQVHYGANVIAAIAMLRDAHAPDDDGMAGFAESLGEAEHIVPRQTRASLERFPGKRFDFGLQLAPTYCSVVDKVAIDPAVLHEVLHDPVEESNVAADVNLEEVICETGSKKCALCD